MSELFAYIIKVSIALLLFYGLHILLLRKDTFFKLRRAYFLSSLLFSLVFPFITLKMNAPESEVELPTYWLSQINITYTPIVEASALNFDPLLILLLVLSLGIAFFLGRFFLQLASIRYMFKHKKAERVEEYNIIRIEDDTTPCFSFFNRILLNTKGRDDAQLDYVFLHEQVHVKQYHSIDVVLYELLCACFWWNPIAWLMKKEMKLNLEFLADEGVHKKEADIKAYQYLLLNTVNINNNLGIINNFNISQLKNRIIMMNKKKTPILCTAKFLLFMPLAAAFLLSNAVQASPDLLQSISLSQNVEQEAPQDDLKPFMLVEQMPQYTGGNGEMMKFISANLKYPKDAATAKIEGRVIVRFVVSAEGNVQDAEIQKSLNPSCDAEAIRVVEAMPKWTPGKQNGKAVPVYYTLPIVYRLTKSNAKKQERFTLDASVKSESSADMKDALFLVDGKVVSEISSIDPKTIKSISVHKNISNKDSKIDEKITVIAKEQGKTAIITIELK